MGLTAEQTSRTMRVLAVLGVSERHNQVISSAAGRSWWEYYSMGYMVVSELKFLGRGQTMTSTTREASWSFYCKVHFRTPALGRLSFYWTPK